MNTHKKNLPTSRQRTVAAAGAARPAGEPSNSIGEQAPRSPMFRSAGYRLTPKGQWGRWDPARMEKVNFACQDFVLMLANQGCEVGPIPVEVAGKTFYCDCLGVSRAFLEHHSGMTSPCWPCQARRVVRALFRLKHGNGMETNKGNEARRNAR